MRHRSACEKMWERWSARPGWACIPSSPQRGAAEPSPFPGGRRKACAPSRRPVRAPRRGCPGRSSALEGEERCSRRLTPSQRGRCWAEQPRWHRPRRPEGGLALPPPRSSQAPGRPSPPLSAQPRRLRWRPRPHPQCSAGSRRASGCGPRRAAGPARRQGPRRVKFPRPDANKRVDGAGGSRARTMRLRLWLVPALVLLWGPGGLEALGRPPRRQRYGKGQGGTTAAAGGGGRHEGETTAGGRRGHPHLSLGVALGGEWGEGCGAGPVLWGAGRRWGPCGLAEPPPGGRPVAVGRAAACSRACRRVGVRWGAAGGAGDPGDPVGPIHSRCGGSRPSAEGITGGHCVWGSLRSAEGWWGHSVFTLEVC